MTYTSKDNVKAYLGIPSNDTSKDALFTLLVQSCSDFISGKCSVPSPTPGDIELLCIKLVCRAYERRDAQGVSSVSAGGASVNYSDSLDDESKAVLSKYRKFHV